MNNPGVPLPGIEHIVLLMLENRSFDNILGAFPSTVPGFDGIPPGASNTYVHGIFKKAVEVTPSNSPASGNSIFITPNPDPGETASDVAQQIYNGGSAPAMGGFAENYYTKHAIAGSPADVLCYFDLTPDGNSLAQLPMTWFLATRFAVSDRWFASGPVQTFPNRMFSICGMPGSFVVDKKARAPLNDPDYALWGGAKGSYAHALGSVANPTIFQALDGDTPRNPAKWKVYFHDVPLTALSKYVYDAWAAGSSCVSSFDSSDYTPKYGSTFAEDVGLAGEPSALPKFSIIEPRYWGNYSSSDTIANCNHPGNDHYQLAGTTGNPIDVRNGEGLLAQVLAALLRNAEVFNKTLLIVTYDEHGGCWDHVPPRSAVNPFTQPIENSGTYSNYGVRVPALLINPAIAAGSLCRPSDPAQSFDHTSIIATVAAQFGVGGDPLTPRVASAPLLESVMPQNPVFRPIAELIPPEAIQQWVAALPKPSSGPGPRKPIGEHQQLVGEWLRAKAGDKLGCGF